MASTPKPLRKEQKKTMHGERKLRKEDNPNKAVRMAKGRKDVGQAKKSGGFSKRSLKLRKSAYF